MANRILCLGVSLLGNCYNIHQIVFKISNYHKSLFCCKMNPTGLYKNHHKVIKVEK
jgi:hypothetical protein